jgi:hypothetical protein
MVMVLVSRSDLEGLNLGFQLIYRLRLPGPLDPHHC